MSKLAHATSRDTYDEAKSDEEFQQDTSDTLKDYSSKKLISEIKHYIDHEFFKAISEINFFLNCDWRGQEKKLAKVCGEAILYASGKGNDTMRDYLLYHPKCEDLLLQGYPYFLKHTNCCLEE